MTGPLRTTVVIPAYNAEEFLERTLDSVLAQTHRDLEVLIVNDGSTDDTEAVARVVAQRDARVGVLTVENGGVAKARNVGLAAATGEYVAFLDADDLWHPTKIEAQLRAMNQPASVRPGLTYARMRIIDEDDMVVRNGSGVGLSGSVYARHLFARPVGNGSSVLTRREIAQEVGGFDPTWAARGVGGCEDLDFELKIAARYPVAAVPQYLVGYRSHPANMSSNRLSLARAIVATVAAHLAQHPELPPWAVRKVRASALEFALQNIALARDWKLFARELAHLLNIDFGRGLEYAARFPARTLIRDTLGIRRRALQYHNRPPFYSLDPSDDAGLSMYTMRVMDRKIMGRLAVVDAADAGRLGTEESALR